MSKKLKKVCIFGHYGNGLNLLNGQTVKTKILTDELGNVFGQDEVMKIDTHGGIKTLIKSPIHAFSALKKSSNVAILPAHNGLRVYAPLLSFLRGFFKGRKLHYIVIGGWLPEFLKKRPLLKKCLLKFDGIYVETNTMKEALFKDGFKNVIVLPNCKKLSILTPEELVYHDKEPYPLCTFSRVMKEKGIEDAVNAVKNINEKYGRTVYTLDIYGQVDSGQIEWFEELKSKFPEYITYGGLVPFDKSTEVLKNYFALLFPTYYEGEGFAGTLIDAFAAGVPVIASDWKYNGEIVDSEAYGVLTPVNNIGEIREVLDSLLENCNQWNLKRTSCLNKAALYKSENVINSLLDMMN